MTRLQVIEASVRYPRGSGPAMQNVSLTVEPGQAVGVVGESGSGKTTLARVLAGVVRPSTGSAAIDGQDWASVPRSHPRRRAVQMVFQDPYSSLNPYLTAREAVAEVFRVWEGLGRRPADARAGELLEHVGLRSSVIDRRPRELSGGQCQRVGIARALACSPAVLIADEPTSSLDVSVQAQIVNLLVGLRAERNLALVLISHDLALVRYATNTACVMYRGRVVETGPSALLLAAPQHPYTHLLVESHRGRHAARALAPQASADTTGCVFAFRCEAAQSDCRTVDPDLQPSGGYAVACHHPLRPATRIEHLK